MMTKSRFGRLRVLLLWLGLVFSLGAQAADSGWAQYKQRFLLADGRIVDTGNNNVSHTEGQGFAMLLAVYNDDRPAFDNLWQWTRNTLYRQDIGLFSWRYEPGKAVPIADKNNATDGDILIAWALLKAGKRWNVPAYLASSAQIQQALLKHTVIDYGGYRVMLPSANGFRQNGSVIVNPSYFVFPAWHAFYQESHLPAWKKLIDDSMTMVSRMRFGKQHLPSDWVTLQANGQMAPASDWAPRFGFDAVRVPLYLYWDKADSLSLSPFASFWRGFDRRATPAWLDVLSGQRSEYNQSPGMRAVRDLTVGDRGPLKDRLAPDEDYYSASLHLLAYWAQRSQLVPSPQPSPRGRGS